MINVTKLSLGDLKGLKELYEDGFEGSVCDLNKMTQTFETISLNKNYNVLCAKIGNKVVGSVMGIICYELFGDCLPFMVIENVAVHKDYRRQGIAKQLMVRQEEWAVQNKCSMIIFVSSEHRTSAHKLYESLGYGVDKVNGYRKRLSYESQNLNAG